LLLVVQVMVLVAPALAPAATQETSAPPALTTEQQEAFLATARVVKRRAVSKGVTGTVRATLTDGTITHDASIQTIDVRRSQHPTPQGVEFNFRDSWKYNVAAYRLGRLLGIDMIPPSIERKWDGEPASFTWWVDDVLMDERERATRKVEPPEPRSWHRQILVMRVFDQLIANVDRNQGNLLIAAGWRLWMIDHSRSFRSNQAIPDIDRLTGCDRQLLERLRALDYDTTRRVLGEHVTKAEVDALFKRRDLLVAHFDALGPKALYDLLDR
jgi:hypothetical protein